MVGLHSGLLIFHEGHWLKRGHFIDKKAIQHFCGQFDGGFLKQIVFVLKDVPIILLHFDQVFFFSNFF